MTTANDFIGQTKKGSQNLAEARGLIFRLIRVDAEDYLAYPEDQRMDRVCVEIDNGKVTKATVR